MSKNFLPLKFVLLPMSYYYFGPIIFLTYLYSLKSIYLKFHTNILIICTLVLSVFLILLLKQGVSDGLIVFRFFWGWILFYLFFSGYYSFNQKKLLKILSLLVVLEALAINTVVPISMLPNYPDPELFHSHYAAPGHYQRPFSFGGSASVTSVLLVALLAHANLKFKETLLPASAILCCMSGSGFFTLLIYLAYRNRHQYLYLSFLIIFFFIFYAIQDVPWKFSLEYLNYLYELKLTQIRSVQFSDTTALIFGNNLAHVSGMGGDFQFLSFINLNGFFGLCIFVFAVFMNLNKYNWLPIFLLLLGSLHYGVIFYFPGQFIFGYFLASRRSD